MHPLEREFFKDCLLAFRCHVSVRDIFNVYCDRGYPPKRLGYYVEKWVNKGFYEYGVNLLAGWFWEGRLTGEYLKLKNELDADIKVWKGGMRTE